MGLFFKQTLRISVLASLPFALASCSNPAPETPPPSPPAIQFPANISSVFTDNCVNCHTADNVGTFSLLPEENGWENAVAQADAIVATVINKQMPPFLADNSGQCNTFINEYPMSAANIATVSNWVAGGTPADTTDSVMMQLPALPTLDPTDVSVVTLSMKEAYTPKGIGGQDNEDSRCFVIEDEFVDPKLLTAFEVIPGNTKNVHHVQLYVTNREAIDAEALTNENFDAEAGYSCYGDTALGETNASLLATWTPGTGATTYPNGTGIRIPALRFFIMKIHYLVKKSTAPGQDITSIKLKLADIGTLTEAGIRTVVNDAANFILPAGNVDAIYTTSTTSGLPYNATIHALMPHMHDIGTRVTMRLNPGTAGETCLIDIPQWNPEWQRFFFFQSPSIIVNMTDIVAIECHYNTFDAGSDTISGPDQGNEHCMAHLYVVPIL